ncbi:MAG TPA: hypothetical protein VFT40_13060 [Sphingomicrobium sp.]|nr:hypothetical protein [Sphingomicrobium sp.]
MVGRLPDSLHELVHLGGVVRVKCRKCGREARFSPYDLSRWFRVNGIRDEWKTIRRKFRCDGFGEGCGSREVEVTYELEAPEPPRLPPEPRHVDCPPGIDPIEWAKADSYEKRRLVRRSRG